MFARRVPKSVALVALVALATFVSLLAVREFNASADSEAPTTGRGFDHTDVDLNLPPLPKSGNPKLQTPLNRLAAANRAYGPAGADVIADSMALTLHERSVRVVIEALPGEADAVSAHAASLDVLVETTYRDLVQLVVPVALLDELTGDEAVAFVRLPLKIVPLGAITGEGVSLIGANDWHSAGFTGAGVKVAILDSGFEGYTSLLGSELPGSVITHSCRTGGITAGGAHGTAVTEIVHETAPDAQLYLANFSTVVELGNCVDWLKGQGVDVVNASFGSTVSGPGDGTGVLNDIVDDAKSQGILWVNASGNHAQRHWAGTWSDPEPNGFLNFSGIDETNAIDALAGQTIEVLLRWNDPFGTSCNDYDLYLYDSTANVILAFSQDFQNCSLGSFPTEALSYVVPASGTYHVVIHRFLADGLADFHLYSTGANHDCPSFLQYCVKAGSLLQPADNADVLTAGAVPWNSPNTIESFSSQGPTDDGRTKPDLVAPDNVNTATFGSFPGTSASAPHASGAAALVMEWHPDWSQNDVRDFLMSRAVDLGASGADNTYGEGRLDLGVPKSSAPTPTAIPPAATSTPVVAATNTPIPAATNTPVRAATNTPVPPPSACVEDPLEENDTQGTATSVTLPGAAPARSCPNDDDWFSVPLTPGAEVQVDAVFTDAEGDIDITLHTANGTQVADSFTVTDNEKITFTSPSSGTYALRVYLLADSGTTQGNSYTLAIGSGPAGVAGDVDCNNQVTSIDAALMLQLNVGIVASLPCQSLGDVNGDGFVNAVDAALVLQVVVGLIPVLPV